MAEDPTLKAHRRTVVADAERSRLAQAGGLSIDARRTRPRYFDGRFLAARDLTGDQLYVLARQADLARAGGWGVVSGLSVRPGARAIEVTVGSGLGVTPGGETVVLPSEVTVDLIGLRQSLQLDAHLGLRSRRTGASRLRTGAFVLALRPVEYTANPRQGYPTSIDGERRTEDHDIVEATALTLVPWPTAHAGTPDDVRKLLAREIFVEQTARGLAANVLPIAMVFLDGRSVVWIDEHLVRRPVGAEQEDVLGLGLISRAVRMAHVRQYGEHLRRVLASAHHGRFAAAEHFEVLPPIGELPSDAIDTVRLSQGFFPPAIDVDVSLVPEDELPLLLEESAMLPPIDLRAPEDELASTSVLVLAPVRREIFRQLKNELETVRRPLVSRIGRVPVVRTPLLALGRLRLPALPGATLPAPSTETSPWTHVLAYAASQLGEGEHYWYVRRRNFNFRAEIEGFVVDIDVTNLG
ncbi:MAG: hypothetical protein IT378_15800 [Sandaracinaceae bacterium]|nr:hypothetical protein [Sandaracinaceae bacterium]